jgi:hypothetical protein
VTSWLRNGIIFMYEPLAKRLVLSGLGALLGPAGRP